MSFEGMSIKQAKTWTLPFGKHKGKLITEVFIEDEEYLEWLHDQLKESDNLKQAIELACWTKEE